ncbi:MAG TPA: SDR family NAD(P)-dependent oxidoreductase [Acidimicrobiales bacterium]
MGRLDGKIAIVSGGARGMGASHCRTMVAEGAQVVIGDVLEEDGATLAKELGDAATFVPLDVTDEASWSAGLAHAVDTFGPPSILVNNAGIVRIGLIPDMPKEDFEAVLAVNLVGVWLGMRAVAPAMMNANGGSIINVSSTAGLTGYPGISGYVASKWGVRGITKSAALEFGTQGRARQLDPPGRHRDADGGGGQCERQHVGGPSHPPHRAAGRGVGTRGVPRVRRVELLHRPRVRHRRRQRGGPGAAGRPPVTLPDLSAVGRRRRGRRAPAGP